MINGFVRIVLGRRAQATFTLTQYNAILRMASHYLTLEELAPMLLLFVPDSSPYTVQTVFIPTQPQHAQDSFRLVVQLVCVPNPLASNVTAIGQNVQARTRADQNAPQRRDGYQFPHTDVKTHRLTTHRPIRYSDAYDDLMGP
jgi:hypothetical protein